MSLSRKHFIVAAMATFFVAGAAMAPRAEAVLIAYEGFDFDAANISTNGSGTGWGANNWGTSTGGQYNTDTGLGYSNSGGTLASTGNSVEHSGSAGNIMRILSSPVPRTNGTEMWVSFLSDQSSAAYHNVSLFSGSGAEVIAFGAVHVSGSSHTANYAIRGGNTTPTTSSIPVVTNGETQLLVMQLVYNVGGSTTARLYLNPTLGAAPTGHIAEQTFSSGNPTLGFDRIRLEMSSNTGNFIDEVRIGTTWQDVLPVVPESHTSLLALGCLGSFCLLRRRKTPARA